MEASGRSKGREMREPSRQQAVLIFPLSAVGVVGGKGRLGQDIEPSKQPEGLIEIKVADVTAAFLVQQLQGEQTQQSTGGGDHARAGIARLGHELVELELGQERQKEENASDPSA